MTATHELINVLIVLLALGIGYWLGYRAPKDDETRPFD